ncbi:MAG TPA: phosphohistidine phosphatase SixA [Nitrososphaerales archaeon]|nr:phosphohistidine phosphatase SixA [Nitrososphaerales archaeon]
MDLFILRHGEAGTRMSSGKDNERSLTEAGRMEMARISRAMATDEFNFDVVASSPLKRAKETAEIVNRGLKRKAKVEEWMELRPEGSREDLFRRLSKYKPDSSVLFVGHEPYLTSLIGELIGRTSGGPGVRISLKKGGMAKVSVSGSSVKGGGELRWLLTPRQIRKLG